MRKKIVLITGGLASGGSERFTAFLCNHLPNDKYEKVLIVCSLKDQNYTIDPAVRIINLNVTIKFSGTKVFRLLRKEKPDIVFSTLMAMNIMVAMVRAFFPKRMFFILRESSIISENIRGFRAPEFIALIVRYLYPGFFRIVAQSAAMQRDMIENFGISREKIVQIYNPVAPQPLKPVDPLISPLQLITVGNIRKEKGHERIVRSLQYLSLDFHYTIVGGGEEADIEKLKSLIESLKLSKRITLVGSQKDPFFYLNKSALFLQGSYFEGFPNCLLEANSVGLPIVAFECPGGTGEILEEGVNGFSVPDNDEKLFAAVVEKAAMYSFDAVAIRARVLDKFNREAVLKQYDNLFEQCVR